MKINNLDDIKSFLKEYNDKKIFIISGKKSYKLSTAEKKFKDIFHKHNVFYYFKINFYPEINELIKIIKLIKKFKPDLILAIGGGSVIDYAKIASCYGDIKKIKNDLKKGRFNLKKITTPAVIPTTAGSGAEVTSNAVMYIDKIKYSFEGEALIPNNFFLLPELILKNDKKLKASAGIDAIAQALESMISIKSNSKSFLYASNSLRITLKSYINYLRKPDKHNSSLMLFGAMLAGKAINISKTTAPHAISYPFTSIYKISHGHAVSLTLEKFLKFNFLNNHKSISNFNLKNRYEELFKLFGVKNIFEFEQEIKIIKKKAGLEDNYKKLGININTSYNKIISGVNLLRLKNNPIKIEKKDLKFILLNKF